MVKENSERHVFSCTAEHFWSLFLTNEDFQAGLYKRLKLEVVSATNVTQPDGRLVRTMVMAPDRNLPGFVASLVKGASKVTEINTYDPVAQTVHVQVELPVVGKRTVFRGVYRSKPLPDDRFERTFEGFCEVKIPLMGKKLEGFFMEEMAGSVETIWSFAEDWLKDHRPQ